MFPLYLTDYYLARRQLSDSISEQRYQEALEQCWTLLQSYIEPWTLELLNQILIQLKAPELAQGISTYQHLLFSTRPEWPEPPKIEVPDSFNLLSSFLSPTQAPKVSLCMIVKNEEKALLKALRSAEDLVDEIILVDTGSTDQTAYIAQNFSSKVKFFEFQWTDNFSEARNYSLAQANGDWILVLDADEELTSKSQKFLKTFFQYPPLGWHQFSVSQLHHLENGKTWLAELTRIFRNHPDLRYHGLIHEQLCSFKAPYYLHGIRLNHRVFLNHSGMQNHALERHQKHKRVNLLKKSLETSEDNTPYARYQYAQYLAFQTVKPDYHQAEALLFSALEESINKRHQAPLSPTWHSAPMGLSCLSLFRIWSAQKKYQTLLDNFESYQAHCHYAEFYWLAAEAFFNTGQFQKARYWFNTCFDPKLSATLYSAPYKNWKPLQGLLKLALKEKNPWLALSLVHQLLLYLPDESYLIQLRQTLYQELQLTEAHYFEALDQQMVQALKNHNFVEMVQIAYCLLSHHFDAVIFKDLILALGLLGYTTLAHWLWHFASQLFPHQPGWAQLQHQLPTSSEKKDLALLPGGYQWFQLFSPATHKPKVSLVMIIKNEAELILNCLNSVEKAVDEIILVDTGSTDQTFEIVKSWSESHKVKIFSFPWQADFSAARNFAQAQASGDWIFSLDADEQLHPESLRALQWLLSYRPVGWQSYAISRQDLYDQPEENTQDMLPRIYRNDPRIGFFGKVHNALYRNDYPALLYHCRLPQIQISHEGYRQGRIQKQNKPDRLPQLKEQLKIKGYSNPYYHYHYAWSLLYQQSTPEPLKALAHLNLALQETLQHIKSPPVIGWLPGPLKTMEVCISRILFQQKQYQEIQKRYSNAQNHCDLDEFHYYYAQACYKLQNWSEAKQAFQTCLTKSDEYLQPHAGFHSWRPHYGLMKVAQAEKNVPQAITYCEKLLDQFPEGRLPSGFQLQEYLNSLIVSMDDK